MRWPHIHRSFRLPALFLISLPFLIIGAATWVQPRSTPIRAAPGPAASATTALFSSPGNPPPAASPEQTRVFASFDAWASAYGSNPQAADAPQLAEGLALAEARREALKKLIATDPEAALRQSVRYVVRRALPLAVQELLEEPVNAAGSFEVSIACGFGEEGNVDAVERFASFDDQHLNVYTYGRRLDVATKKTLSLNGIAIDDVMALRDQPARVVPPDEAAARGLPAGKFVVEVLGEIRVFASQGEFDGLTAALIADEEALGPSGRSPEEVSGGPAPLSTYTEGVKSLLYIICDYPNLTGFPVALSTISNAMNNVTSYYYEASYRKTSLVPTYVPVIVRLPRNGESYTNAFSTLLSDATDAAQALGYNADDYDRYVVLTDENGGSINFSYAGKAWIGSPGCHLVEPYYTLRTAGHELGHNFGLYHANYWRSDSDLPNGRDSVVGGYVGSAVNAEWIEYGHRFSVMSAQNTSDMNDRTAHFAPKEKRKLDWLTSNKVAVVTNSQIVRLYRFDNVNATQGPQAVHINRTSSDYTGNLRQYWLGYRRAYTANGWLAHGLQVDWTRTTYGNDGAVQLDMTPYSNDDNAGAGYTDDNNDKYDGAILIGRTASDVAAGIHITPTARGGSAPDEWIDVVVNIGTFPTNRAPDLALTASSTNALTNAPLVFTAGAVDPDGDALAYEWDFGLPALLFSNSLNQAEVTNSWSTAGEYVVRCVASDMKGGRASTSIVVRIGSPTVYGISGRVLRNGQPVENARVYTAYTNMTYTGSDGRYQLVNLRTGSFTVAAQKDSTNLTAAFTNPVVLAPSAFDKNFGATGTPAVIVDTLDDGISVAEGGDGDSYVIRLASRPTNTVNIAFTFNTNQLTLTPTNLALAPNDWLTGQTVSVSAVDDILRENQPHTSLVSHAVSSADPAYNGLPATTASVLIVDNDSNLPPAVAIDSPTNTAVFVEGAIVLYTVSASDPDGTVTQVVLSAPAGEIATWDSEPYSISWTGLVAGTHVLAATAWDADGASATSAPIQVEVLADLDRDGDPDVTDPDDDGDGLPDIFEEEFFGDTTNGVSSLDEDEDGFSNLSEYIAGTNPTNALSYFHITAASPDEAGSVSVDSVLGRLYTLQERDDLMAGNTWSNVSAQVDVEGTGTPLILTDPEPKDAEFYRMQVTCP